MDVVADASAILCALFPDESSEQAKQLLGDYAVGLIDFYGPRLLMLELLNSCLIAKRRNRITEETFKRLTQELSGLQINWVDIEDHPFEIYHVCNRFNVSSYDAAYIVCAQQRGCDLLTADHRLYNAVKDEMPFVRLIKDYQSQRDGSA